MIDTKILVTSEELYNELLKEFPQLTGYVVSSTGLGTESNIAYINTNDAVDESTLYDAIYRHDTARKFTLNTASSLQNAKFHEETEDNKMDNKIDELLAIVDDYKFKRKHLICEDTDAQIKRIRIKNKIWIELEKFVDTYDKLLTEHNHAVAEVKDLVMSYLWDDVFYTDDELKKIDVIKKSASCKITTFENNMETVRRLIKAADTFEERYQILRSYDITDTPCKCECLG